MQKISEDIALQDFERWFDSKKLSGSYRKESYEVIEKQMVEAICDGNLIVNEDFTLTLKLAFPLTAPNEVNELNFVHRIQTGTLQARTAWAKTQEQKLLATIAALTGVEGGVIRALDSSDYSRAGAIASYFF